MITELEPQEIEPTDYIELTREPFEHDTFNIMLQDGRAFEVPWTDRDIMKRRMQLDIPDVAFDAVYNFNAVHWYPRTGRLEIL